MEHQAGWDHDGYTGTPRYGQRGDRGILRRQGFEKKSKQH